MSCPDPFQSGYAALPSSICCVNACMHACTRASDKILLRWAAIRQQQCDCCCWNNNITVGPALCFKSSGGKLLRRQVVLYTHMHYVYITITYTFPFKSGWGDILCLCSIIHYTIYHVMPQAKWEKNQGREAEKKLTTRVWYHAGKN